MKTKDGAIVRFRRFDPCLFAKANVYDEWWLRRQKKRQTATHPPQSVGRTGGYNENVGAFLISWKVNEGKKQSILKQIDDIEYNMHRLRILVEADLAETPNVNVPMYCLEKSRLQIENIGKEFQQKESREINAGIDRRCTAIKVIGWEKNFTSELFGAA